MDCQNMGVRGMCIVNLPLTFIALIETKFLSFSIFHQSPTQVFSCEICEIFRSTTYFEEDLQTTASDIFKF